jgi:hypothetical protein
MYDSRAITTRRSLSYFGGVIGTAHSACMSCAVKNHILALQEHPVHACMTPASRAFFLDTRIHLIPS